MPTHSPLDGQLSFDLEDLIRQAELDAAGPWRGAPLHFTTDYYSPEQLQAAFDRFVQEHGRLGCLDKSHMWHPALCDPPMSFGSHVLHLYNASLPSPAPRTLEDDEYRYRRDFPAQAICPPCRWHSIHAVDQAAIEAWHDHAMPGWRDLPTFPAKLARALSFGDKKRTAAARTWAVDNYPPVWQVPGAPILTLRPGHGTRHVPARSPFGGYDLCIGAVDEAADTQAGTPGGAPSQHN